MTEFKTPSYERPNLHSNFHPTPPSRRPEEPQSHSFSIQELLENSSEFSTPRSQGSLSSFETPDGKQEKFSQLTSMHSPPKELQFWKQRSEFLEGKIEMLKQSFAQNLKGFINNHESLSHRQQSLLERVNEELQNSLKDINSWQKIIARVKNFLSSQ